MPSFLLDTHVWLWMLEDDRRLGDEARETILDERTELFLSAASIWEISIKLASGRLEAPLNEPAQYVEQLRLTEVRVLPIDLSDAVEAGALPRHHADPFDRMIVAQARLRDLPVLSADRVLDAYEVAIVRV